MIPVGKLHMSGAQIGTLHEKAAEPAIRTSKGVVLAAFKEQNGAPDTPDVVDGLVAHYIFEVIEGEIE